MLNDLFFYNDFDEVFYFLSPFLFTLSLLSRDRPLLLLINNRILRLLL